MSDPTNPGGIDPTASPSYPPAPPVAPPVADSTAPLPPPVGQWAVQPAAVEPAPAAPKGRRGRAVVASGVALALLAGGTYATAQLLGDERGAASPEEAGERLLAAINQSDLLGVIDLLPPGEQQALLDITDELSDQGDRLGLLDDTFRLDGFPGLTIEVSDPELEVEELGDGIARVSLVDGEASVELDGDVVSGTLGEVVEAIAEENDVELEAEDDEAEADIGEIVDEAEAEAEDNGGELANPFQVTVIEIDGRWFPSVGFTIAEFARLDANRFDDDGPSAPDLGDGIDPDGSAGPEEAVQALLDAATGGAVDDAIAVLDPGELGALQVYADVLFDDLDEGDDTGLTAELTDAEVTSLGDGVNRVVPTGLVVEGDLDGDEVRFELDDGCVTVEAEASDPDAEDVDVEVCGGDEFAESLPGELGEAFDDVEVPDELSELLEAFQPVEFGVITVERDGEHFVSPTRTLFDLLAVSFRGLERDDLEEGGIVFEALTGGLDDEFEEFFDDLAEQFEDEFLDEDARPIDDDPDDGPDDVPAVPVREPTGPTGSGPAGELVPGDVVAGSFPAGGEASFVVLGAAGDAFVGAQATDGGDLTVTLTDVATGEELDFNDDFIGLDPEAFAVLTEGQAVLVTIRAFGGSVGGEFVVYYET
jgi:hypothetical protein